MTVQRIVSRPRGSWKFQDAFTIATYTPHRTRDGRWVWRSIGRLRGKWSMPQLRRLGIYSHLERGSLHHRPISPDDLRWLAIA